MLGLLTRVRRAPVVAQRRSYRPLLEALEHRYCPAVPVITALSATPTTGKTVQVTGTVTDSNPASVTVMLGGVVSGTAPADANGHFIFTGTASSLGTVNAVGVDGQNQHSSTAQAQLTAAAPTLTLNVTYLDHRNVQLSGRVTAGTPGGLTVGFRGEVTGSTVTAADGTFSVILTASALGEVDAGTMDVWGQPSNIASLTLASNAPIISNFQGTHDGTTWTFTGTVTDESAPGETVTLGGIQQLQGVTVTVASDGTFTYTCTLPSGLNATATAVDTDWWGLQSDAARFLVLS